MLWANYRRGPSISVPAPYDDKSSPYWWYDRIANWAYDWARFGITDVLFPQPCKTNAGAFRGADGYGVYDDYDIGSKNTVQFGGMPTRFGYADQLRRAIAVCHANGMNVLLDVVQHQRMGGRNGIYNYLGSDGKTLNGRFAKFPSCFRGDPPRVPEDPVPSPPDDFAFGDELCPVNGKPTGYVWNGLIDAGDWLFRTTDADGARLDDMKGMAVDFMKDFMTSKEMANNKWYFGEFASGSANSWYGGLGTNWWVDQVDGLASASDFDTHYNAIMPMCNNASGFNMANLIYHGMIYSNPMKSVPFVESMDSDTNGFATVVNNKVLGYAYLLTNQGLPQIYIRDYLTEPNCYGLMEPIRNLSWCSNKFAHGYTIPRLRSQHIYVYERTGPPGAIVALNSDVYNPSWYTVTVQTNIPPGTRLHDHTGKNGQDCWVQGDGTVTFGIPPGANGTGYGVWASADYEGQDIKVTPRATTQDFDGAADLDILPLSNNEIKVGRIWCGDHQPLTLKMLAPNQQPADFDYKLRVGFPDGSSANPTSDTITTSSYGWYDLYATGVKLSTPHPFTLRATYYSTQHLKVEDFAYTA
jgi:alpha-amylase